MPSKKKMITPSQTQKILKTTVRNARNLKAVYRHIDSDMSHLIKNFRANYMKQLHGRNDGHYIRSSLDVSGDDQGLDKVSTVHSSV